MRTRAVREGSVGLLFLLGLGLFVGLFLWLRGLSVGERSYKAVINFPIVNGLQEGGTVRFRGVNVGKISTIRPKPNGVEVDAEISPANLIIPRDVIVEANQSGLISEVNVDITPQRELPRGEVTALPLDPNCDRTLIICNGSQLQGQIGISTDELIRNSTRFLQVYSNQELFNNVNAAARNASIAANSVSQLTRELSVFTRATGQQLGSFAATTNSVQRAANQISASTTKTASSLDATAAQFKLTAVQANRLIANLDSLLTTNRSSLVTALNNLAQTSQQLRTTVNNLTPTLNRVNQGQLIQNLETLTANAAQASANLRDVSNALNNPTNLLTLQQTLDSARVTFGNAQKITSDLDELTGDPAFRNNVRDLINGLSSLVSSTQQIQQQVQVAQTLDSVTSVVNNPQADTLKLGSNVAISKIPTVDRKFASRETQQSNYTASSKKGEFLAKKTQPQWLLDLKASRKGNSQFAIDPGATLRERNSELKTHLPITNYQLPTTNYQLPLTDYQLPISLFDNSVNYSGAAKR